MTSCACNIRGMPNNTYIPAEIVDAAIEYIDYLPEAKVTAEVSEIWRLLDKHATARTSQGAVVVDLLQAALSSALENLPDVADDPAFGADATAQCCADIAALSHLLATDAGGNVNIAAYLE